MNLKILDNLYSHIITILSTSKHLWFQTWRDKNLLLRFFFFTSSFLDRGNFLLFFDFFLRLGRAFRGLFFLGRNLFPFKNDSFSSFFDLCNFVLWIFVQSRDLGQVVDGLANHSLLQKLEGDTLELQYFQDWLNSRVVMICFLFLKWGLQVNKLFLWDGFQIRWRGLGLDLGFREWLHCNFYSAKLFYKTERKEIIDR